MPVLSAKREERKAKEELIPKNNRKNKTASHWYGKLPVAVGLFHRFGFLDGLRLEVIFCKYKSCRMIKSLVIR